MNFEILQSEGLFSTVIVRLTLEIDNIKITIDEPFNIWLPLVQWRARRLKRRMEDNMVKLYNSLMDA